MQRAVQFLHEADRQEVPGLRHLDVRAASDICIEDLQPSHVLAMRARRQPIRPQNTAPRVTILYRPAHAHWYV